jgi:hypothetical protein
MQAASTDRQQDLQKHTQQLRQQVTQQLQEAQQQLDSSKEAVRQLAADQVNLKLRSSSSSCYVQELNGTQLSHNSSKSALHLKAADACCGGCQRARQQLHAKARTCASMFALLSWCMPLQAASQCDAKLLSALDGKLRLLAAEVDRLDGQAAIAAQAQVRHHSSCTIRKWQSLLWYAAMMH